MPRAEASRRQRRVVGGRVVPRWWDRAIMLATQDKTRGEIAATCQKSLSAVAMALESAYARELIAAIDAKARARLIEQAADPRVMAQLEAPAAMGRLIGASRNAEKPMEVAAINKDVLNYAGYAPAEKKLIMSVTAEVEKLPLAALEEWERTGVLPAAVAALMPPAPDGRD